MKSRYRRDEGRRQKDRRQQTMGSPREPQRGWKAPATGAAVDREAGAGGNLRGSKEEARRTEAARRKSEGAPEEARRKLERTPAKARMDNTATAGEGAVHQQTVVGRPAGDS